MLCDFQSRWITWQMWTYFESARFFHGGTKANIILLFASQKYGSTAYFPAPSDVKHTFFLFVSFWAGIHVPHTHTPHMNIHSLSASFSRQPPEIIKTLDLHWRERGMENALKQRMVEKESTDFNSQNSSGWPRGKEGWGERERGKKGCQQELLSLSKAGVRSNPLLFSPPPSVPTHTQGLFHTHSLCDALIQVWCRDTHYE